MERPNAIALGVLAICIVGLVFAGILGMVFLGSSKAEGRTPDHPQPLRPLPAKSPRLSTPVESDEDSSFRPSWKQVAKLLAVIADVLAASAVAVWVARDSSDRGHDGALWGFVFFLPHSFLALWPLLAGVAGTMLMTDLYFPLLLSGWLTLPVYLLSRRRGLLVSCGTCPNRHLAYVLVCPHCGRKADH